MDFAKLLGFPKFKVLAFPCNQFGGQEPGEPDQIVAFAKNYVRTLNTPDANFWLMEKANVNGPETHPVYQFLKKHSGAGGDIRWNFATKFLVACRGETCDVSRHDGRKASSLWSAQEEL
mmetsp:Transcript_18634/g.39624  ORF Transcript_18634/g.39624 Transcript_18634/m.39624 type:complete len:119 (-) Transcript_18634:184-540(-)